MSKTDTKAESGPTSRIRNRMIPQFHQRPVRAADSFVSDVDTERPPPRFLIAHRASHSDQQGPSRRREDERASAVSPGKPGLTAWDHSDMSTTARP